MTTQVKPEANLQTPARKRQRDAFERTITVFRNFRESATSEEMERIAQRLEQAVKPPKSEHAAFLAALMSSVDSYLNSATTLYVNDFYRRFLLETDRITDLHATGANGC